MNTNDRRLVELIEQLPEVYQPIFGHPELASSRVADSPRMEALVTTVTGLSAVTGRPLRIVDLGSAQGFTSCTLAALGHRVIGIDYLDANVAVARHLAGEHPGFDLQFFCGDVTGISDVVDLSDVDLVIGLSVLHHLVYRDGVDATREFVDALARRVPHGIYEMALREEPVYWGAAQPADPRVVLDGYAFIRELVHSGTHLSDVARPTLFCSNSHCVVEDQLLPIESFTRRSHALVGDAQSQLMRYVFWKGGITKTAARFDEDAPSFVLSTLRADLRREARVLELLDRCGVDAPRLVEFVDGVDETILSRTTFPGELLSDVVAVCSDAELRTITGDVLRELAALERAGLYHCDLRLWNVVVDRQEGRARLIDHGAVQPDPTDVVWPFDPYFSFLAFVRALWETKADATGAEVPRSVGLSSPGLPHDVVRLVSALVVHERDDRVFADVLEHWDSGASGSETPSWPAMPLAWEIIVALQGQRDSFLTARDQSRAAAEERHAWETSQLRQALEDAALERERLSADLADHERRWQNSSPDLAMAHRHRLELELLRAELGSRPAPATDTATGASAAAAEATALSSELASVAARNLELEVEVANLRAELTATRATLSWRVTKPLRTVRRRMPSAG